jgi:hypothetical protein
VQNKNDNILATFLELLKVKHTRKFTNRLFNEHPHKYNLFGLSKMLSDYGVENAATRIEDRENQLPNIETPFIAHTGVDFVIVENVDTKNVHYLWNNKDIVLNINDFIKTWSGVVLLTETTETSGEPNYKVHQKQEILDSIQYYGLYAAIFAVAVITFVSTSIYKDLGRLMFLLLNLAGLYIGFLLIQKQLHINSKYGDKICSLFKQRDCNDVLESDAAKLWGIFGWSEIGFGYFAANIILILFLPQYISYLAIINILALPYSFWSVWYQKVKAKQWCVLCLIVQVLLWAILINNLLFGFIQFPEINLVDIALIISVFVVSILSTNITVPIVGESRKTTNLKQEINSLKADENVFRAMLKITEPPKSPSGGLFAADSPLEELEGAFIFGNPSAKLQITILSNPYCNPCARMHKRVEKLLKDTDNQICIEYILSSFSEELESTNRYLIAAALQKPDWQQTVSGWFEKGKPQRDEFFKDFNLDMTDPRIEEEFQRHKHWKEETKLQATPTVLVAGYKLPDNYQIEDLRYFTDFNIDIR